MSGMADTNLTGAWPLDPSTETGLFRQELGDTVGVPHEPSDGKAEYQFIGDAGIAALILAYPSSRDKAMSKAMWSMANQLILLAEEIQVDDIRIKTVERARLMMEASIALGGVANTSDAATAFNVVPLSPNDYGYPRPQGTPYYWGSM